MTFTFFYTQERNDQNFAIFSKILFSQLDFGLQDIYPNHCEPLKYFEVQPSDAQVSKPLLWCFPEARLLTKIWLELTVVNFKIANRALSGFIKLDEGHTDKTDNKNLICML